MIIYRFFDVFVGGIGNKINKVGNHSPYNCNVKYIKFFIDSEVIKKQFEIESRGGVQNFVSLSLLRNLYVLMFLKLNKMQLRHLLKMNQIILNY